MSRKRKAPKKIQIVDPKFKSAIIPKLINSIMYDGKKTIAEKIIYEAIDKIKSKSKDEPINVFNFGSEIACSASTTVKSGLYVLLLSFFEASSAASASRASKYVPVSVTDFARRAKGEAKLGVPDS